LGERYLFAARHDGLTDIAVGIQDNGEAYMISKVVLLLQRLGIWPTRGEREDDVFTQLTFEKFNLSAPTSQAIADIFHGHWASDLGQIIPGIVSGPTGLFNDPRVGFTLKHFAGSTGDLRGQRVLELGPLEAAHTYQLERLGADVVAIEANTEAYLKCLIVKELTGLTRARFLYGDFIEYLRTASGERFDQIFCCGVLYHMADPVALIEAMAARTNRVFVWTHYATESASGTAVAEQVDKGGQRYTYYRRQNVDRPSTVYWGGGRPTSALMSRDDILRAFAAQGFIHSEVHQDELEHPGGPCFSVSFWKE
jgi:SAM-dependent methyltransferase